MNLLSRIFFYFFVKSFIKKMLVSFSIFVITYFGMGEMPLLQSAIGQQEYEITQQIDIEMQRYDFGSERILKYRVSNTGIKPLSLKIGVQSTGERIDYKLASVFKIYSTSEDQRIINVDSDRPYQNYLALNVSEVPTGLGLELYFLDQPSNKNFLNNLNIEITSTESINLYKHELNYSPLKIVALRLSLLFLGCFTTTSILFMMLGFFVKVIKENHEITSVD